MRKFKCRNSKLLEVRKLLYGINLKQTQRKNHINTTDYFLNGYNGLIQRNMELQTIIIHEKKVNEILKERLKKFESLLSGGITKKIINTTTLTDVY